MPSNDDEDFISVVAMEFGSQMTKLALAGEYLGATPGATLSATDDRLFKFPSVIGSARTSPIMLGMFRAHFYGDEAIMKRGILKMKYPFCRGTIIDDVKIPNPLTGGVMGKELAAMEVFEKFVHHSIFNEVRIPPEDAALVIVLPQPYSTASEKLSEMMTILFEAFNFRRVGFASSSALIAFGAQRGEEGCIVVDIGAQFTTVTAVGPGYNTLPHSALSMEFGLREFIEIVTHDLYDLFSMTTPLAAHDIASDVLTRYVQTPQGAKGGYREWLAYFRENSVEFDMGDGRTSDLSPEVCCSAPETLFSTDSEFLDAQKVTTRKEDTEIGHSYASHWRRWSLQEMVQKCVHRCPTELHGALLGNILVTGGGSKIPGIAERLEEELQRTLCATTNTAGEQVKSVVSVAWEEAGEAVVAASSCLLSKDGVGLSLDQYEELCRGFEADGTSPSERARLLAQLAVIC